MELTLLPAFTPTPRLNLLSWLNTLRPAIPMSAEAPGKDMSNGELKRLLLDGGVLINTERVIPTELMDFPVFSLVFFPRSKTRKTTIV